MFLGNKGSREAGNQGLPATPPLFLWYFLFSLST